MTSANERQSMSSVGPDGVVRCYHKTELPLLTSKSTNNPGRKFYKCIKARGDPDNCGFFKWANELANSSQMASMHSSASQPITPLKRVRAGTPLTPTISPLKTALFDRSDPTDINADNNVLSTDEEVDEILLATDTPLAKKFKCHRPEEMLGRSLGPGWTSRTADQPSTMKTQVQTTSEWPIIRNNPFHAASVVHVRSSAEHPLSSPATSIAAGDSIQQAVDILGTVSDTVRKLERKLNAAEKARDAKAARIVKLEKDIQDLKDRNRFLEEALEVQH